MDDADRAEELIEQVLDDALADAHVRATTQGLECTGFCRYCGDPAGGGRRFCNADCRDAWQHEQDLKMMRGVG